YVSDMNLTAGSSASFELTALNKTNVKRYRLQVQCCEYEKTPTTPDFFLRPIFPIERSIVQGSSATYEIRIIPNAALPYTNPIALTAIGQPEGSNIIFQPSNILPSSQPSRVNVTITTSNAIGVGVGNFMIMVTASHPMAIRVSQLYLTVIPRVGFDLSIYPSSRAVSQGNQAIYTVTVRSSGGFSSQVTLSYSNIPQNSVAIFDINPVTPTSTGTSSTLTISTNINTALGSCTFNVCGVSGSETHCVDASITVTPSTEPYFTISVQPTQKTVMRGGSTTFNVAVTSHNGFNSDVSLTLSGLPAGTFGTFNPSPVRPPPNGIVSSTLNISAATDASYGTYNIIVTGSSSGYSSQQVQVTLIVSSLAQPDFGIHIVPTTLSIVQNRSGVATIQIVSINNFAEAVNLTLHNIPPGITYLISNPMVAPLPGGYVNTKLTIQTSSSTSVGNYTLTLRGESSSKTHTVNFFLVVVEAPPPSFGRCIVATATYGSELSPQVQFLREFRDRRVLSTFSGRAFMDAFNIWYYSFSPEVASWLKDNPSGREVMKVMLIPLLGILQLSEKIYVIFEFAPEPAITMAGMLASFLIGLTYFCAPATFILKAIPFKNHRRLIFPATISWLASIALLAIGVATSTAPLVMAASTTLVLCTVTIGSWSIPMVMLRVLKV
ncbi:MAG: CFI-box-CTERM domain-containing protein, partial [Candidatus Bathyarchaeia archaeon]